MVMIRGFRETIPKIASSASIAENAVIIGDVEIGEEASVWYNCVLRGDVNYIRIGDRTNIQDMTMIHVSREDHPTVIECEVTVGHSVTLHGCYIESGSLIGIGSTVLDGARIGRNSLVAAGSLVTPNTSVPEGSFVVGSPARVKRQMSAEEISDISRFWKNYVELSTAYREGGQTAVSG